MKKARTTVFNRFSILKCTAASLLLAGCTAPVPPPPAAVAPAKPRAPEVIAAEQLFEQGKTQEAIVACCDIARKNPSARGLSDLQLRITDRLAEERMQTAKKQSEYLNRLHTADAHNYAKMPDSYRQRKHVMGETGSLKRAPSAMQQMLKKPVTIDLEGASISTIAQQIGRSQGINIITDDALASLEQPLTIHVEKTPLDEVLEYIGRNMQVNFSVGENVIWVTAAAEEVPALPLETRIYKIRKGMVGSELGKSPHGESIYKGPQERGRSSQSNNNNNNNNNQQEEGKIKLLEAIERFVPQPDGADFLFDDKAHVLIVKNTKENLALTEDLIDALDVRPLQILIEARFVTTSISDFHQLGIDWLFDNRGGSRFNTASYGDHTLSSSTQFKHDALVGAVTEVAATDGSASGGLKLAYQFLLGDSALQAVLHALEQTGESQAIVVPRITVINNREASFRVGEDHNYFEDVDANTTSSTSYSSNNDRSISLDWDEPMTLETGTSLSVTPSVGADLSTINLILRPEISDLVDWDYFSAAVWSTPTSNNDSGTSSLNGYNPGLPQIKLPRVSRQYIETEAVVHSGETVVLGGLIRNNKSHDDSQTPWLAKIPYIGKLFQMEKKNSTVENVLIFVTATLISDIGEELIPLNEFERYGEPVSDADKVPDILKTEAAAGHSTAIPEALPDAGANNNPNDAPLADIAPAPAAPVQAAAPAAPAQAAPAPAAPAAQAPAPAAPAAPAPAAPAANPGA